MMDQNETSNPAVASEDVLLGKLLYLKRYETPETSRMVRNRQNIMRQIRQSHSERRGSLLDRIEGGIPWFFAEPRYGIAALFLAFIGLQYVGMNARQSVVSTGIYTSAHSVADTFQPAAAVATNRYPTLPSNYRLFGEPEGNMTVVPVGFEYKQQ